MKLNLVCCGFHILQHPSKTSIFTPPSKNMWWGLWGIRMSQFMCN